MITITILKLIENSDVKALLPQIFDAIDNKQIPILDFNQCEIAAGSLLYALVGEMVNRYGKEEGAFSFRVLASEDRMATIRKALAFHRAP